MYNVTRFHFRASSDVSKESGFDSFVIIISIVAIVAIVLLVVIVVLVVFLVRANRRLRARGNAKDGEMFTLDNVADTQSAGW